MKECTKCRQKKEIDEFSSWENKETGKTIVSNSCNECVAKKIKPRNIEKREDLIKQVEEKYAEDRELAFKEAERYYKAHKDKVLEGRRINHDVKKSVVLILCAKWKASHPEEARVIQMMCDKANKEEGGASANTSAQASTSEERRCVREKLLKLMAMEAYGGPVCACCSETLLEALSIDHIGEDGAEHRLAIGNHHLYRWLIQHNCPPGFQVLCMNCNYGKYRNGGICPHKAPPTYSSAV